jgi:RsiW-degrading membrane proteinase PrsW (M82 family)
MAQLLALALIPVFILLFYVYFRDKYEKEPIGLLIMSIAAGALITIPIVLCERMLTSLNPTTNAIMGAVYNSFVVAAFTEEIFKFFALFLLIWRNKAFNERFDGIVYAVFISLGFAAVENVLYVFNYGTKIGLIRAFTAVPAHALFGTAMGYYFAKAKFRNSKQIYYFIMALAIPILLHGIYNFILMSKYTYFLFLFIPFLLFIWRKGFIWMKDLSDKSIFRKRG